MKFQLLALSLFSFTATFAQKNNLTIAEDFKLREEKGKTAYELQHFTEAQTIFTDLKKDDPTNPNYNLYLGLIDVNVNNGENACNLFKSAYTYNNQTSKNLIRRYCNDVREQKLVFLDEVEQQPKFTFNEQVHELFYLKEVTAKSGDKFYGFTTDNMFYPIIKNNYFKTNNKIAKSYKNVIVTFTFTKNGIKILSVVNRDTKKVLDATVSNYFTEIFNKNMSYSPALVNNQSVNLFNTFSIPISVK